MDSVDWILTQYELFSCFNVGQIAMILCYDMDAINGISYSKIHKMLIHLGNIWMDILAYYFARILN